MKEVYGYTRVSTTDQGEVSLPEQKSDIKRYAEKNNLKIVRWFEEKKTAAKQGRPIFIEMMKLLREGKAEGLIVHKIDRSARNLRDWAELGELMDSGIDLHFSFEAIDFNTRGGRLSADIQAVIAADYIRNLRDETKKGLYGRLKQGLYPYCAPIGYLNTGGGNPKEIDPDRGLLIRKLFQLYATGLYTIVQLESSMYEKGLRTVKGKKVTRKRISKVLNNPFYMGVIKIFRTGETYQGIHKPLITKALYSQVQEVLSGNRHNSLTKRDFQYRRCIQCGGCGKSLTAERQKGHVYYRCKYKSCSVKTVREEFIDMAIEKFLNLLRISENDADELRELFAKNIEDISAIKKQKKLTVDLELSRIESRIESLTEKFVDDLIDNDVYIKTRQSLLIKKSELNEQLQELEKNAVIDKKALLAFIDHVNALGSLYSKQDIDKKRRLLKILCPNLCYMTGKLVIEPASPFKEVAYANTLINCALYCPHRRTWASTGENYSSKNYVVEYELTKTIDEQFKVAQIGKSEQSLLQGEYVELLFQHMNDHARQCHEVIKNLRNLCKSELLDYDI